MAPDRSGDTPGAAGTHVLALVLHRVQTGGVSGDPSTRRGRRAAALSAALVVAAALGLSGCRSARSETNNSPSGSDQAEAPTPTTGVGGTAGGPGQTPGQGGSGGGGGSRSAAGGGGGATAGVPCRSSQLAVKLVDATRGSAGWADWLFELRNTSVTPCTLAGYPTVQLLDRSKHPLATLEQRGAGPALTGRMATTVPVPAGGAAVFGIETYGCAGTTKAQAPAANLLVTPPGDTVALQVAVDPGVTSCDDGRFVTSPVRSDPSGVAT